MDIPAASERSFSNLRSLLFPVYKHEFKKIIPMGLMMVLIIFNFWVAHNSKDIIVISAPGSGAEVIHFLKVGVFIVSIIFVMLYTWLSNILDQRTIFYSIVSLFMGFFLLFAFVIYPNQETLHMSPEQIVRLKQSYPHLKWLMPAIGYWGFALFYIFSEMWSVLVITLLFWQFANQITTVEQSKRCYMIFSMFNGIGGIVAGCFFRFFSPPKNPSSIEKVPYEETIQEMFLFFAGSCLLIMLFYYLINKYAVPEHQRYHGKKPSGVADKTTISLSFWESFKYILSSRYVGFIAIMTIAYNISLNFVEITWKSQVKLLHNTHHSMQGYLGDVTLYMGVITFLMALVGLHFVRRVSWKKSAMVTPILMSVTGIAFFTLILFEDTFNPLVTIFNTTPLLMALFMGQTNNLASKSCKFSFFDITREMAYIPLDAELKVKGKAAVDIMGGRVGKLGGSLIQGVLLSIVPCASQTAIAPYIVAILGVVFLFWFMAIRGLHKEFMYVAYGKKIDD